jgi:hypothetical protein
MDGGSAENAGAIFRHSIHGDALKLFLTQSAYTPSMEIKNENY